MSSFYTYYVYIHVHVIPVCPFALSVSFDIFILRVTFNLCIMYCCLQNAVQDSNFPFLIFFISQTNANCCLKNIHNIWIHVDNHYIKSEYKIICVYIRVHIWSFVNLATPHKGNNSVYLSLPTLFQQLKYLIYVSLVIDILLFSAYGTLFILSAKPASACQSLKEKRQHWIHVFNLWLGWVLLQLVLSS